jgi:hypothetical protein
MILKGSPPQTIFRQDAVPRGRIGVFTTLEQRSEKNMISPPTRHLDLLLARDSILPRQVFPVAFFKVARYPSRYLDFPSSDLASVMHMTSASTDLAVAAIFSQLIAFQQFEFQNTTFREALSL